MSSLVLHFGSRSGTWFALVLGPALLVAPVVMVYASSLRPIPAIRGRQRLQIVRELLPQLP